MGFTMYLMLDFETLGNAPDTIAVSLGAVAFNKEGIVHEKLWIFDATEQIRKGRSFTASTLDWWMHPSRAEARRVFYEPQVPKVTLSEFIAEFEAFVDEALFEVNETRDSLKPMGNGANFDVSLIEDLYRTHFGSDPVLPWKFWNVVCFRTMEYFFKVKSLVARPHGTYHSALDDARYQANCVIALLNKKKGTPNAGK